MTTATKIYDLTGQILEACSCKAPCPCWIGNDPDDGYCDSFVAYHIEQGMITADRSPLWAADQHTFQESKTLL